MKMKYLLPAAMMAVLFAGCNKAEVEIPGNDNEETVEAKAEIKAEIVNTKTTYDDTGKFSWASSDKITVVVYNDGTTDASKLNVFDHYTYNNSTGAGENATFTGSAINAPWHEYGVALYPNANMSSNNCLKEAGAYDTGFRVYVNQEITPNLDNPLEVVPLIGRKNSNDVYQFKTAMGILQVTVTDIPADAYYLYLYDPSGTFAFSGYFEVGSQDVIKASDAVSPSGNAFKKTIAFTPAAAGETRTFYFPVPVGTIPAGTQLKLDKGYSGGFDNIMIKTLKDPVPITANHVTPLKAVAAVPQADVLGTYTMAVTNGSYSSNHKGGLLVIEDSDDASKGRYMMTKFADIEGKQYGYYDGTQLIFPEDQLFAANPYSATQADYPYIALDAYTGGVTPAKFNILDTPRRLQYDGDQIGFRATTDDLWYNQSHNGAWPWSLGFASLVATRVTPIPLTASMITPIAVEPSEGSVAGLVDGDRSTYWHSPWSVTGTYDSTYGIYIDIDLGSGNELKDFQLRFCLRNSYNDHPNHVLIYASTDGTNWGSAVGELNNVYSTYGYANWTDFVTCNAAAKSRYIRLSVLESYGYNGTATDLTSSGCTHMAEIELYSLD